MAPFNFSNVIIQGGTFNSAQGDLHIHNRYSESGLHTLRQGVSLGAIHDSFERYPPPNCLPDTRNAVLQIILDWIHSESSTSFFWLYGSAGAGKTAILQKMAEFLCSQPESDRNFGGSFFFSRGKKGCDKGHFLFSTIAYQLALKVPGLRQHVNHIMELDPTLHTKSIDVQLRTLIIDAFRHLSPLPQHPYLVIVDGLDECHDKATQQSILQLLCEIITVHKLPLRFLIGSRPESHIRDSFDQESLYTVTRRVILDEKFNPGRDIEVFLRDGFAKICANNSILSHVGHPWPGEDVIDLLVHRSSGQFIYAATVLKFVGADFCSPTKQLALILKPDSKAFSDLDQLYTQILSIYPRAVNIVRVLGIISVSYGKLAEVMEDIFGMEEGELKVVLRGLSSLMKDEKDDDRDCLNSGATSYVIPHFAHASFGDYLFDSRRSGPFHVNREEYENQLTIRSFALAIRSIWTSSTTRIHTITWDYFTESLAKRFINSPKVVKERIMTDINDLVQGFWNSSNGAVGTSFFLMRSVCLLGILQKCYDSFEAKICDYLSMRYRSQPLYDRIASMRDNFKILFDGYRKMIDQSFSKSKDLGDMLKFLPGVVVLENLSMQGMADLYRIKPDYLKRLKYIELLRPLREVSYPGCLLDDYLSDFLQDRDRSQLHYCDLELQHISICRQILSLLDRSNVFALQSNDSDLFEYVQSHFYGHLCDATSVFLHARILSDDHPAVKFFHDLETTAYNVDENLSSSLSRFIIQSILRWADNLTQIRNSRKVCMALSISNVDLTERVCHLTSKIYREILCIATHGRPQMTYITIGGLDHVRVSPISWSSQYKIALSWELLDWIWIVSEETACSYTGFITTSELLSCDLFTTPKLSSPCSFTAFITTPELSGPLYISPDIYHTQITEYLLETILHRPFPSFNVRPDWADLNEHISHALPTEKIFYLLQSTPSESLLPRLRGPQKLNLDTLEIIIKWLQGLGSERPSYLYTRFQAELLHYKSLP